MACHANFYRPLNGVRRGTGEHYEPTFLSEGEQAECEFKWDARHRMGRQHALGTELTAARATETSILDALAVDGCCQAPTQSASANLQIDVLLPNCGQCESPATEYRSCRRATVAG